MTRWHKTKPDVKQAWRERAANEAARDAATDPAQARTTGRDAMQPATDAERQVQHLSTALAEAQEDLAAISFSISHDLRAPLRAIDGYAALLGADKPEQLDDEMRQFLAAIRTSARQMGNLIDGLLELSRVTRCPIERQPVDVSRLANLILAALAASEPTRRVVAAVAPDIVLQGDNELLHRALGHLLGNAWKYSARQAVVHITLTPWRDAARGEAGFCVADDGPGFDSARAARLFEPFSRGHLGDAGGAGIGLTTVRRVVHRHHGRVWAESQRGEGARFYVALPDEAAIETPR